MLKDKEMKSSRSLHYLREIISIPSISDNERDLAHYFGERLTKMDFFVNYQRIGEESENVIGVLEGRGQGPLILLAGHLDTVPPTEGWETDPFIPYEEGDRLYGLGASDMKGGLAVLLAAVEALRSMNKRLEGSLMVAFFADEEGFSKGVKRFLAEPVEANVAFMAEPHFQEVVLGAAGKVLIHAEVKGQASHVAQPEKGINAIEEAASFIHSLPEIMNPKHQKIGSQPFVVLNMKGGYAKYSMTVPNHSSFTINKHTVPGETKESILHKLKALKEKLGLFGTFSFQIGEPFYPPYLVEEENLYLKTLQDLYLKTTGEKMGIAYGSGVSDSNCLVEMGGIETINFGPSGGNIHSIHEWVSKNECLYAEKIYQELLLHYLGSR